MSRQHGPPRSNDVLAAFSLETRRGFPGTTSGDAPKKSYVSGDAGSPVEDDANQEYRSAARYQAQRAGLGAEFLGAVDAT